MCRTWRARRCAIGRYCAILPRAGMHAIAPAPLPPVPPALLQRLLTSSSRCRAVLLLTRSCCKLVTNTTLTCRQILNCIFYPNPPSPRPPSPRPPSPPPSPPPPPPPTNWAAFTNGAWDAAATSNNVRMAYVANTLARSIYSGRCVAWRGKPSLSYTCFKYGVAHAACAHMPCVGMASAPGPSVDCCAHSIDCSLLCSLSTHLSEISRMHVTCFKSTGPVCTLSAPLLPGCYHRTQGQRCSGPPTNPASWRA